MAYKKDKLYKKIKKKSVTFTILSSVLTLVFVSVVVSFIFLVFVGYVFANLYKQANNETEKINTMFEKHMKNSLQCVEDYADGVNEYIELQYKNGVEIDKEELQQVFNLVCKGNNFINIGIKMYDESTNVSESIGTLSEDVGNTEFYKKGKEKEYGVSFEEVDGRLYLIYTSPIEYKDKEVGIFYATERGIVNDIFYEFIDEKNTTNEETGIKVCYLVNSDNKIIGYAGNGNESFNYNSINKQILSFYKDKEEKNLDFEMHIEAASTKLGIVGNEFSEDILDEWMTDYNPQALKRSGKVDELIKNEKNILLSKIWYKREINIGGKQNTGLYTLIQSNVYIESITVMQIAFAMVFTILILMIPFLLLIVSTVSKIRQNRKMASLLYLDSITGMGNWLYFEKEAERKLSKRRNKVNKYAMVSFEVNKYRIISDYYGIGFGEELVEKISKELKYLIDKNELFARYAESQYAILLKYDDEEELGKRVTSILSYLTRNVTNKKISIRAGIYLIEDKNMPINAINLIASGARDAGSSGLETNVTMYNSQIRERQLKEKLIEDTMEYALENKEFKVYLQPKYSPETKVLAGAEALVRWISQEKGFISPGEFIPTFEKNGFITKLDDYMLASVCEIQQRWLGEGKSIVPISVNISRIHFADEHLPEHILEIVDKYNVPHEYIELELTESAFFDDKVVLLSTVQKLHEYGFLVSMDDFGAGYSSLNSLKDLPLDVIKLDGEFFNETADKERGETVVRNTITLAKNLNMKIVAEGIETKEQVEFLEKQGCDLIQGFYFAKPMPVEDFEKLSMVKEDV